MRVDIVIFSQTYGIIRIGGNDCTSHAQSFLNNFQCFRKNKNMSPSFLIIIDLYLFAISISIGSNCDTICGICTPPICPLTCDLYCNSNSENPECCCGNIIASRLDCDANGPPCLISNNADESIIFGLLASSQSSSTQSISITMTFLI